MAATDNNEDVDFSGHTVGNWRLVRRLGAGAFGSVYEAENSAIAGRRAAVKVLHPHLSMQVTIKQRFLNEASAASRAEHENIVQVFDGGITPDGVCYVVMELLHGAALSDVILRGPLEEARTRNIGAQVASALTAAHALGIVHRDLKPDNIFIVPRPTNPEFAKVLDFGVAKLRGDPGAAQLTTTGMIIGTPGYMSPEQWMALPDIDGRADIYALGIILFECLTGTLPFSGNTQYEWLRAHLEQPPPDVRQLANASPELAALVGTMLAKRREDRPQSMAELFASLGGIAAITAEATRPLTGAMGATGVPPTRAIDRSALPTLHADAGGQPPRMTESVSPLPRPPVDAHATPPPATANAATHAAAHAHPRGGRFTALMAAVLVVGVVAVGIGVVQLVRTRDRGGAGGGGSGGGGGRVGNGNGNGDKLALLLAQADEQLGQEHWTEAMATTDAALLLAPESQPARERRRRAELEERSRQAYERFDEAAARGDFDAAVLLHRSIGGDSRYHERAAERFESVRRAYIASHLTSAEDAADDHDCAAVRKHAGAVLALAVDNVAARRFLAGCPGGK